MFDGCYKPKMKRVRQEKEAMREGEKLPERVAGREV